MARVYSTDQGKHCLKCQQPISTCICRTEITPSTDGIVRLQRQTKGRSGKPVVIISGLPLLPCELKQLAKQLKSKFGIGGSVEGSNLLIQGDKRDVLKRELEQLGYTVKLAGG
ncbi:MAG: stress response translation initiation inhibitor YciH [Pseudomonadales bacterium]|nr:stress response translation initiation inhibitor YciH [Pseudomonadales bacterium]